MGFRDFPENGIVGVTIRCLLNLCHAKFNIVPGCNFPDQLGNR